MVSDGPLLKKKVSGDIEAPSVHKKKITDCDFHEEDGAGVTRNRGSASLAPRRRCWMTNSLTE